MRRWRVPLALSALILVCQLFRTSALVDVVSGNPAASVHLTYPLFHVLLAPFTLLADYVNGGSVSDLKALAIWSVLIFVLARLFGRFRKHLRATLVFLACFGLFLWWGARWGRPIARLVADDPDLVIFDVHSHTASSRDGRKGFGVASNARWHDRAGFDAAFITDHNVFGTYREWERDRGATTPPRLLAGEELSLNGLHMIALGVDTAFNNKPWDQSFDSSLALLRAIRGDTARASRVYLIASLPEYARNHWGADLGRVIGAGTEGLEIWTTSPKAMEALPPWRRREVIARARSLGMALFGATDMHGLGYAATVWNAAPIPGWRTMPDSALGRALIASFRARPADTHVIARRRALAEHRYTQPFAFPAGILATIRSASFGHVAALLAWCWLPALLRSRRSPPPTP